MCLGPTKLGSTPDKRHFVVYDISVTIIRVEGANQCTRPTEKSGAQERKVPVHAEAGCLLDITHREFPGRRAQPWPGMGTWVLPSCNIVA